MWPRSPSRASYRREASRERRARGTTAAALGLLLLAGTCATPERGSDDDGRPEVERPAPSGTIRLAYPEEPVTLSPVAAAFPATTDLLRPVLPSFHLVTPELTYRPYLLAEEPAVAHRRDRTVIRFRIRRDAVWSDGTPITVADVRFTWAVMRRMADRPENAGTVPDGFDRLRRVVGVGPKEGRLVLSRFAGWRDLFSAGRFVLPAHAAAGPGEVAGWDRGPPVTAGPFRLGEWTKGRSLALERDPGFWGEPPPVERIEVVFVPDATTALQLLERDLVDVVAPSLGISWSRRIRAGGGETSSAFGPDVVHLVLNTERVRRPAVRRGIADAVDRERFAEVVLAGEARTADGVLVPEQEGALPAWETYGGGSPRRVDTEDELLLAFPKGELQFILARFLREELARAGVDVELVALDADVFREEWLPERRFDLALWEARSGPRAWLERWFASDGGVAVSGLSDARLDAMLGEGARGGAGGGPALAAAQRRLAGVAPILPLFQPKVTVGFRPGVEGVVANPTVDGVLWNAWAWSKRAAAADAA